MFRELMAVGAIGLVFGPSASAQLAAFGGGEPQARSLVRVFYWDEGKNMSPGQVAIHYGRPVWKEEYSDPVKFDEMTKGKNVRLGKDYWTTLDTNVALKIGDRSVSPGEYFLAASRTADGKAWELLFIDSAKARQQKMDAFQSDVAPVLYKVPLTVSEEQDLEKNLLILLGKDEKNPMKLTLTIRWGNMKLVREMTADLGAAS